MLLLSKQRWIFLRHSLPSSILC